MSVTKPMKLIRFMMLNICVNICVCANGVVLMAPSAHVKGKMKMICDDFAHEQVGVCGSLPTG